MQYVGLLEQEHGKMFLPSWMNCIDESMSKWVNEYTCPGFMFVPHKPWSFGNEYHEAGGAESDIIWALELQEGKDQPPQANSKPLMTLENSGDIATSHRTCVG